MAWLRRGVQIVAFLVFLALLLQLAPLLERGIPAQGFPQLSPLAGLTASLAARKFLAAFIPALVVLALTVLLGRFFCSWICPLGATLDVTDRLLARVRQGRKWRPPEGRRVKYYLLAALALAAAFAAPVAGWLDPLSIAAQGYTLVVVPYADHIVRGVEGYCEGLPLLAGAAAGARRAWEQLAFAAQPGWFECHGLFLAALLGILLLGLAHRRWWCRALCPLGALLALAAQFSLARRRVSQKLCTRCRRCAAACGMNAIAAEGETTVAGECILCLDCRRVCPEGAVSFFGRRRPREQAVDLSRRGLVLAGAAALVSAPLLRLNPARRLGGGLPDVIRPPGAAGEDEFLALCLRCGQCLRVCRTNGLQPALLESGLAGILTPRLVPRIGHCDWDCTLCGRACPSGAIRPLTPAAKHRIAIGRAQIDPARCLPWLGAGRLNAGLKAWADCNCSVCEEVCPAPAKAIRFNTLVGEVNGERIEIMRPYIVEELCTGCGFCEKVCPVIGPAAVRVRAGRGTVKADDCDAGAPELPAAVGAWRRQGAPEIYAGDTRLFEYIDGAAQPYLTYGFVQVTAARYKAESPAGVKVEVWEFADRDAAFGAFSMNRAGEPEPIGWQASRQDSYLWCWAGRYYVAIEPEPDAGLTPAAARELAAAVMERVPAAGAGTLPAIVAALPPQNLKPESVIYFRHGMIIQDIPFAEPELDFEALDIIAGDARGACGEYPGRSGPARLLLIEYPSAARARKALDALAAGGEGIRSWQDAAKSLHVAGAAGRRLAAVFNASDRKSGAALVGRALSGKQPD